MLDVMITIAVIILMLCSLIMLVVMIAEVIRLKRSWDVGTCTILAMLFSGIILVAIYTIQVLTCGLGT